MAENAFCAASVPSKRAGGEQAEVAVAARRRAGLAEIGQQHLAAAAGRLGEAEQRVEAAVVGLLALLGSGALVDLGAAQADVVGTVEGERVRRRPVAAGAADLLVVALDRFRQVGVDDVADVGLVDAHAEGDGRGDHEPVLDLEAALRGAAGIRIQAGMVGQGGVAGLGQGGGDGLGLGAGGAVDDAREATAAADEVEELGAGLVLRAEGERQVRPVEAAEEGRRLAAFEETLGDLRAGVGVGGGGQRDGLDAAEPGAQGADAEIVRAEVVAPLADAMGLVDGEELDAGAGEQARRAGGGEALGRHVEELQAALVEGLEDGLALVGRIGGGERPGRNAGLRQRADLVAHERDERRDDEGDAVAHQGGQLVAERLAAARRHDREDVAAGGDRLDDLGLAGAEIGEAEDPGEQRAGLGHASRRRRAIIVSP
jgi:hypothetical protein